MPIVNCRVNLCQSYLITSICGLHTHTHKHTVLVIPDAAVDRANRVRRDDLHEQGSDQGLDDRSDP